MATVGAIVIMSVVLLTLSSGAHGKRTGISGDGQNISWNIPFKLCGVVVFVGIYSYQLCCIQSDIIIAL
jgi:hypothetical protein